MVSDHAAGFGKAIRRQRLVRGFDGRQPRDAKRTGDSCRFRRWRGIRQLARRGMRMRARVASLGGPTPRHMTSTIESSPFRYRGARTGRWVKARHKATREEIAARYTEWEITGPVEERPPIAGYFNPGRREGEWPALANDTSARGAVDTPERPCPATASILAVPRSLCLRSGPAPSSNASVGSQNRRRSPVRDAGRAPCLPPPTCPHVATLASAPARKFDDTHAEQPIAAENPRLTRATDPTTIELA